MTITGYAESAAAQRRLEDTLVATIVDVEVLTSEGLAAASVMDELELAAENPAGLLFQIKEEVDADQVLQAALTEAEGDLGDVKLSVAKPVLKAPSPEPSAEPTLAPSPEPSAGPTLVPSPEPSAGPTPAPSPDLSAASALPDPAPTGSNAESQVTEEYGFKGLASVSILSAGLGGGVVALFAGMNFRHKISEVNKAHRRVVGERDAAVSGRDAALVARDVAVADRNAAVVGRDAAVAYVVSKFF